MDGGGIDFVEADFGSEAAAGGGANLQNRSAADWDKWSKRKYSTPLKPFFYMALCFIALISLPWLLDSVQDLMATQNKDTTEPQVQGENLQSSFPTEPNKTVQTQPLNGQGAAAIPASVPVYYQSYGQPYQTGSQTYNGNQFGTASGQAEPFQTAPAQQAPVRQKIVVTR